MIYSIIWYFLRVHKIFESHNVKHILCYGTLWGQIRASELLPWSEKAELCVFKSQLDLISEGILYGSFQRKFLRLRYFSANGFFIVEDIYESKPFVQIYVFEKDDEVIFDFICLVSECMDKDSWFYSNKCSKESDGKEDCCHHIAIGHHR